MPHPQETKINEKGMPRHFRLRLTLLGQELLRGRTIIQIWMSSLVSHQTWQFPLSSHDFGQVCGRINKYLSRSNQILNNSTVCIVYEVQRTKYTIHVIFNETNNDICFII